MAVKVAATGTAVSRVVSSAAVQGFDSTVDQVVYQGYILCNPNYFDVLSVSGMDAFFEENDRCIGSRKNMKKYILVM